MAQPMTLDGNMTVNSREGHVQYILDTLSTRRKMDPAQNDLINRVDAGPAAYVPDESAFLPEAQQCFDAALPVARQIIAISTAASGWFGECCSR